MWPQAPKYMQPKYLEIIEKIVYKNADDIAVSISRSFERLEERMDSSESRIHSRLGGLDDKIENCRQDLSDTIADMRELIIKLLNDRGIKQ